MELLPHTLRLQRRVGSGLFHLCPQRIERIPKQSMPGGRSSSWEVERIAHKTGPRQTLGDFSSLGDLGPFPL